MPSEKSKPKQGQGKVKIGHGFDAHKLLDLSEYQQLYPKRNTNGLVLGGISIPYHRRLEGFSDADPVIHAIIDALLGAAGLEDIGTQFPAGDPNFEAISSLVLLSKTLELISQMAFEICNIDVTIIAEEPKLKPYIPAMRQILSKTLSIELDQINLKATTTEALGFIGRREGIAAHAVCLLVKSE